MNEDRSSERELSRRQFLGIGAGVGAGLLLAACGGKSANETTGASGGGQNFTGTYDGPPVTLQFWNGFTGGDGPFMRKLVKQFSDEQKNIDVKMNTIEWAQYYQRVPAAVNSGRGPDVGVMHVEQLATHAARRVIVPIDDVASGLKLQESDFIPTIWQAGIYNGKRYGIPLDVHSLAMYYNKAQFTKAGIANPPTNKAELDDALSKLQSAGFKQPFWMPSYWPAHLMFLSLLWQFGGEPYSSDGTSATFNSDAGVQALTWMADQIKSGKSPKNVAIDTQYQAFKNDKDSVTWDGIWQINDLKAAPNLQWGIAPVPQIGSKPAVWANSHNFVVMRQLNTDQNKLNASKVFIGWISQHSRAWAGAGMIPARNSERDTSEFTSTPQAAIAKQIPAMHFLPQIPGVGDVQAQTLEVAVQKATLGQMDPKAALDQYASQATQLMAANKKKFG
jgi:multiple sugar transport system substrate-binding protein